MRNHRRFWRSRKPLTCVLCGLGCLSLTSQQIWGSMRHFRQSLTDANDSYWDAPLVEPRTAAPQRIPTTRRGFWTRSSTSRIQQHDLKDVLDLYEQHPNHPRVVYLDDQRRGGTFSPSHSFVVDDLFWNASAVSSKDPLSYRMDFEESFYNECELMEDWQTTFYPTCNAVHELDLAFDNSLSLLGTRGSWRIVWKIPLSNSKVIVMKMLRLEKRSFDHESFGYHQVDSMAMERLTASPYIVNEYGFCGQSVLTEFAEPGRDLIKDKKLAWPERLRLARDLAKGLAHVHSMDSTEYATFAHNDINIANTVQVNGRIKLNDFNIGVLMRVNKISKQPCGYPVRFVGELWRSPEENQNISYVQPEKSDIYSLGNVLFQVMSKHQPWTHLEPDGALDLEIVKQRKIEGQLPYFPEKVTRSNRTEAVALVQATLACFKLNPNDRPSSTELAYALEKVLSWVRDGRKPKPQAVRLLFAKWNAN